MNEFVKTAVTATVLIVLTGLVVTLSAYRDTQVEKSAERYEKCIVEQYGTTPSAYYNEHGEHATCNK